MQGVGHKISNTDMNFTNKTSVQSIQRTRTLLKPSAPLDWYLKHYISCKFHPIEHTVSQTWTAKIKRFLIECKTVMNSDLWVSCKCTEIISSILYELYGGDIGEYYETSIMNNPYKIYEFLIVLNNKLDILLKKINGLFLHINLDCNMEVRTDTQINGNIVKILFDSKASLPKLQKRSRHEVVQLVLLTLGKEKTPDIMQADNLIVENIIEQENFLPIIPLPQPILYYPEIPSPVKSENLESNETVIKHEHPLQIVTEEFINLDGIMIRQKASDCFLISFLQSLLTYYKTIDLNQFIQYEHDTISVNFSSSIYRIDNESLISELLNSGYKISLDQDLLCKIQITPDKLKQILGSKQNLVIDFQESDILQKEIQQKLKDLFCILVHLQGRIIHILENMESNEDVSMDAYANETGNSIIALNLLGFEHKYEISLIDFISSQEILTALINDKKMIAIITMFYDINHGDHQETVGHCWQILKYTIEKKQFVLYNPHGQIEKYPLFLLAHYKPHISIFTDIEDFNIPNLNEVEHEISNSSVEENYLYNNNSVKDYGKILLDNTVFIKKYEQDTQKLFIKYQLFGSEMPQEDLFTGIYNNQFYKAGIIVKNNRTKYILHANTNANGRVLASDKIQYFKFMA